MDALLAYNEATLEKLDALLLQMNDHELGLSRPLLFGGSFGQHVRHILEFYECLLGNLHHEVFSYDRRRRDLRLETEIEVARGSVERCIHALRTITSDRSLVMESELPGEDQISAQRTTLKRELVYLADHSVHHLAMMRIVLEQELPTISFPEHLGVAASTRNHRSR